MKNDSKDVASRFIYTMILDGIDSLSAKDIIRLQIAALTKVLDKEESIDLKKNMHGYSNVSEIERRI